MTQPPKPTFEDELHGASDTHVDSDESGFPATDFEAGARWALTSDLVRQMAEAFEALYANGDVIQGNEFSRVGKETRARYEAGERALNAYHKALGQRGEGK